MTTQPITRVAGPIVLTAGVLLLIQQIVMASFLDRSNIEATMASPLYVPTAVAYFVAFCGLLVALVAAYSWEAESAGGFGLVGFLGALIGTMFLTGDLWFEAFAVPWLGNVAPAALHVPGGMLVIGAFTSYVLFAVGWVLFGLASLRARIFPLPVSIAIVLGGIVGFQAALPPFAIPLAVAIVRARSLDDRCDGPPTERTRGRGAGGQRGRSVMTASTVVHSSGGLRAVLEAMLDDLSPVRQAGTVRGWTQRRRSGPLVRRDLAPPTRGQGS